MKHKTWSYFIRLLFGPARITFGTKVCTHFKLFFTFNHRTAQVINVSRRLHIGSRGPCPVWLVKCPALMGTTCAAPAVCLCAPCGCFSRLIPSLFCILTFCFCSFVLPDLFVSPSDLLCADAAEFSCHLSVTVVTIILDGPHYSENKVFLDSETPVTLFTARFHFCSDIWSLNLLKRSNFQVGELLHPS